MPKTLRISLFAILLSLGSPVCHGESPAVIFHERLLGGGFNGYDQMQGWEFTLTRDLTATKLGLYEGAYDVPGFVQSHTAAIWDINSNLVAFAEFAAGDSAPLLGSFRYVDIPPTVLRSNHTYVIAGYYPAPVDDYTELVLPDQAEAYGISLDPRVHFQSYWAGPSPGGISFPSSSFGGGFFGGFGPNFMIAESDSDGDGVLDDQDDCPNTTPGAIVNAHGCSVDQLAPCAGPPSGGPWRNHGAYIVARVKAIMAFRRAGLLTKSQASEMFWAAFRSDCGVIHRPSRR